MYMYIYGCESKCKVWIMLRAHMCSRPTIQTSDPDPFRGNDPDVMVQTEMMNNSIDVGTPFGGLRGGENIPNRKLFGWGYFLRPCWCYVGPILGNLGSNLGPDWVTWGPTWVHFGRFGGLCRAPWRSSRGGKIPPTENFSVGGIF